MKYIDIFPTWVRIGLAGLVIVLGSFGFIELSSEQQDLIQAVISDALSEENLSEGTVTRVVDGDTIKVMVDGEESYVRLIGVNTPESVDRRKPVECFGQEASDFVKGLVEGEVVTLVTDSTQQDRDRYDRLLRYVYIGETHVNAAIIENGYGFEYTVGKKHVFADEFRALEAEARAGKVGLWSPNTCLDEYDE